MSSWKTHPSRSSDAPTQGDESVSGEMVQAEAQSFPCVPPQANTRAGLSPHLEGIIAEERPSKQNIGLTGG